jgi:hypothetical protein
MKAEQVVDRLQQLNQDGWVSALRQSQGKLGNTVEFA